PLDKMIVTAVLSHLDTAEFAARLAESEPPDFTAVGAEVVDLERRLESLAEQYASGELDDISWRSARNAVTERLEAARRRYAALAVPQVEWAGRAGELREAWPSLPIDEQRAIVATVIDRIVIMPAVKGRTVFDPGRFTVEWR